MELFNQAVDLFLHLDRHLADIIERCGVWTYVILFVVIFLETGLVVTPFLPGDSLLFAVGVFAAKGSLDPWACCFLLTIAAILGDTANYWIGAWVGPRVFAKEGVRFLNKKHLVRAHDFYERYGGKTIIIARFVPIVRTFAPFVAGIARMTYARFLTYNVVGGIVWVFLLVLAGYLFGGIPFVQKNFSIVILAIIVISVLPAVFEIVRHKMKASATP